MVFTYSRKQALSLSALNPGKIQKTSKFTPYKSQPKPTVATTEPSGLKSKQQPTILTTSDEITLRQGQNTYSGQLVDDTNIVAIRTVSQEEQQSRPSKTDLMIRDNQRISQAKAIEENRERLMVQPQQDEFSFPVKPGSSIQDLQNKLIFQKASAFTEVTGSEVVQRVQPKYIATVETKDYGWIPGTKQVLNLVGIDVKTKKTQVVTPHTIKKPPGEYREFDPAVDLRQPTTFFGIKEPGFQTLRQWEYNLEKAGGTEDIKMLRSGKGISGTGLLKTTDIISPKAVWFHGKNVPLKAINRPITTTTVVAGTLLAGGLGGGTGSLISSAQAGGGLIAGSLAVMRLKESQAGGTGSRTLGFLGFTAVAGLTAYGIGKGIQSLKKTDIKYKITSRGTDAKEFTGVTQKGSRLQGKPYKEAFFTKGDITKRTIHLPKSKLARSQFFGSFKRFQEKPTVMKITETKYFQAIKYFKGSKLVGQDFKYIKPSQTIQGSVIPQITSRQTFLKDSHIKSKLYSELKFSETTKGTFSKTYKQGSLKTKVNIKVAETFKRNVQATDQFIITRGKGLHSVKNIKPEFAFGKKSVYPKDVAISQQVGFGKNAGIQETLIVQPRVSEATGFHRTAVGTVRITNEPLISRIKLQSPYVTRGKYSAWRFPIKLGKAGSLTGGGTARLTNINLQPVITISPKKSPNLSLNLPSFTTTQRTAVIPLLSLSSQSDVNFRSKVLQAQRTEAKITPINLEKVGLKEVSTPKSDTGSISKIISIQDQQVGLATSQKSALMTTVTPSTVINEPITTPFNVPGTPAVPTGITPIIPILPPFEFGGFQKKTRSKGSKVISKSKYRPSVQAFAFNIVGKTPKGTITPFQIRPLKKKKKKSSPIRSLRT